MYPITRPNMYIDLLRISTDEHTRFLDITPRICEIVLNSMFDFGLVNIKTRHTTTGLYLTEFEPRLMKDLALYLNRMAPIDAQYLHDDINERDCPPDEPINGHSHVKSAFFSQNDLTIPLIDGELQLGEYERIIFAEFDGPVPRLHKKQRECLVTLLKG